MNLTSALKNIPNVLILLLLAGCSSGSRNTADVPSQLTYDHPGLITDLGVGLWAWPLPMDYDGDGDLDLVVSCPDTPFNGLYFFENPSGGKEKLPVFRPPVKLDRGEMNLQVSFTENGPRVLGRGVEYADFPEKGLSDPQILYPKDSLEKDFTRIRFSQWKLVDYENDGDQDLIVGLDEWGDYGWDNAYDSLGNWTKGPLHGYVYLLENVNGNYLNRGKLNAGGRPIAVYGAPSPIMEDFDGDGDLDLVCGEFIDRLTWFENIGTRELPVFAEGRMLKNDSLIIHMDLQMIIPVAVDWDQDGDMDLIVGDEDGRVALIEHTGVIENHMPVFAPPVYFRQEAGLLKFGALVTPVSTDWDGDGDEDLICGNTAGYIGFIENLDGGDPPSWNAPVLLQVDGVPIRYMAGMNGSIQGPAERKWGYTTLSVADWDQDGLKDIVVNSILGRVDWFRNTGTMDEPSLAPPQPVLVAWKGPAPKPVWNWWSPPASFLVTQWRTTPCAMDWNGDGLTDLVMLDQEGYLSFYERKERDGTLILEPGRRIFYAEPWSGFDSRNNVVDSTAGLLRLNAGVAGGSGRRKFCFADWDQDGDPDLLVNSLNVAWFENRGTGDGLVRFVFRGNLSDKKLAGHTTSPTVVDWDRNGVPDLLVGAEDGHFYYFPNQGSQKK